jgi:hypothetical protein
VPPEAPPASHRLLNLALYQTGWFACVLGAAHDRPTVGAAVAFALVLAHCTLARDRRAETSLVLLAGFLGLAVDTANLHLGILVFHPGQPLLHGLLAPAWIVALWMQFATLFRFALVWILPRPALAALFGALGGPLAFWAGARLGAATLHPDLWPSLAALSVTWAIVVPALARIASKSAEPRGYRIGNG